MTETRHVPVWKQGRRAKEARVKTEVRTFRVPDEGFVGSSYLRLKDDTEDMDRLNRWRTILLDMGFEFKQGISTAEYFTLPPDWHNDNSIERGGISVLIDGNGHRRCVLGVNTASWLPMYTLEASHSVEYPEPVAPPPIKVGEHESRSVYLDRMRERDNQKVNATMTPGFVIRDHATGTDEVLEVNTRPSVNASGQIMAHNTRAIHAADVTFTEKYPDHDDPFAYWP